MEDLASLLHPEIFTGKFLVAHFGHGSVFQPLYQDIDRYESVVHGEIFPPIMKGNKIFKGKLYNNITLIDSYNYSMTG